jgi:uncharacterized protein (TIGR02270 family)
LIPVIPADASALPASGVRPPLVSWSIVEECLDEAEFLWQRRDGKLLAHDWTLSDLESWVERRLLGALEGLVAPGAASLDRVLGPGLASDETTRVAVSAYALLTSGVPAGLELFRAAFLAATDARLAALGRGLELVPAALDALAPSVRGAPPPVLAAWLDACAFQQRPTGYDLGEWLGSRETVLQRAGARLLRFADPGTRQSWYAPAVGLADPEARALAVESLLIAGLPQAKPACRELAAADLPGNAGMLLLLAMLGTPEEHEVVLAALGSAARQEAAIWALGFGGRRAGADACLELVAQGHHEKLAAEAFCAITGLDLQAAGLTAPPPPEADEPIPLEQENLDAKLVPEPEELLPAPDVGGVIEWWKQHRGQFADRVRYLGGRPSTPELLHDRLLDGPLRRRQAWALELAAATRGRLQVESRAFAAEQTRQLASFAALPRGR